MYKKSIRNDIIKRNAEENLKDKKVEISKLLRIFASHMNCCPKLNEEVDRIL